MGLGGDFGSVLGPEGEKTKGPAGVTPSGGFDGKKKLGDRGRKGFQGVGEGPRWSAAQGWELTEGWVASCTALVE